MKTQLATLHEQLATYRPDYFENLQPGITTAQLQALQEKYSIVLPEDMVLLYQWKNGQRNNCYEALVNNSMFVPLQDVLERAADNTSMIGLDFEIENWWHKDWLPLFSNGGGDDICYDMGGLFTGQPGQLIEFWHADNDRNVIAPSLTTFLDSIIQFYSTTSPEKFDEYFQVTETAGYPKKFILE